MCLFEYKRQWKGQDRADELQKWKAAIYMQI